MRLIAEIGGNHEGDFEYAKYLTHLAASANVDFVKLQIYSGASLVNGKVDPGRKKHFDKFSLSVDQYKQLISIVQDSGKQFIASIWDSELIDIFVDYSDYLKVGSGDLTAFNLLHKIARTGKTIILSTGLSTMMEIKRSVEFIRQTNPIYEKEEKLILLQCTSMYPIENKDVNLNVMQTLRSFGCSVGYSDHTEGNLAAITAFTMGAEYLEFHFTDTREGKVFRDHKVSFTREEIDQLQSHIKSIKTVMGSSQKHPLKIETDNGHDLSFRRSVYLRRRMKAGAQITENDLVTLRPVSGIPAQMFFDLIGKTLKKDIDALVPLEMDDFS